MNTASHVEPPSVECSTTGPASRQRALASGDTISIRADVSAATASVGRALASCLAARGDGAQRPSALSAPPSLQLGFLRLGFFAD
jgi:hypothetical protein